MNVGWKFVAVLALLFSLTALVLEIVQIQRGIGAMREEFTRQMDARDRALVDALFPRINAMRAREDLPSASFHTLEAFMSEVLRLVERVEPPSSDPNS